VPVFQEKSGHCYAHTLPLLIAALPRILSIHVAASKKMRKCLNFDTEIRWHLYGKSTAKGWNRNFCYAQLYGKSVEIVLKKYCKSTAKIRKGR